MRTQATSLNSANGRIACCFHARDVNLVLGPSATGNPVQFRVFLDGQAPGAEHGVDVDDKGNGTVTVPRLYQLVRQRGPITDRQFNMEFLSPASRHSCSRSVRELRFCARLQVVRRWPRSGCQSML
jgi:hypothetical protein